MSRLKALPRVNTTVIELKGSVQSVVLGSPTLEGSYLGKTEGRRPKDRSCDKGVDSNLPGWQPKENCQSRVPLLEQHHLFATPRSRGVGTLRVAGPLATSLRGLWVSGFLPLGNGGTNGAAATQEPTK